MSEFKKIPAPQLDELGLSDEELESVSGGGAGEIVGPDGSTTIIIIIVEEPDNK